jgi:hypothetical protein
VRKPTVNADRRYEIGSRALATIFSRIHPTPWTRREECLNDIFVSVTRIEADKLPLLDQRDNLKRAVKALEKADKLIPEYGVFSAVHETIRDASHFIGEQAKRLNVSRSGGPGEGSTERKGRAAAEAYVLIRRWQNRVPDGKDTAFINLASQLYEAATGETGTQANCANQCAVFVEEIRQGK